MEFRFGGGLNRNRRKREQGSPPVSGLSNPMDGVTLRKTGEKQLWGKRNQKFSSGHAHLKVPIYRDIENRLRGSGGSAI